MGKHQLRLLRFAIRFYYGPESWHSYQTDRTTVKAVRDLEGMGLIVTNEHRQFQLAVPAKNLEKSDGKEPSSEEGTATTPA